MYKQTHLLVHHMDMTVWCIMHDMGLKISSVIKSGAPHYCSVFSLASGI